MAPGPLAMASRISLSLLLSCNLALLRFCAKYSQPRRVFVGAAVCSVAFGAVLTIQLLAIHFGQRGEGGWGAGSVQGAGRAASSYLTLARFPLGAPPAMIAPAWHSYF